MGILNEQRLYFNEFNLTAQITSMNLGASVEAVENTTFNPTANKSARTHELGLHDSDISIEGLYKVGSTGDSDDVFAVSKGLNGNVFSVSAETALEGERVQFTRLMHGEYTPISGGVGDLHKFSVAGQSEGVPLVDGIIMRGDVTNIGPAGTINGTSFQLGAVTASQSLYAAIHLIQLNGSSPSIDVLKIQSDDNAGMTTPIDRLTFTVPKTTVGSELIFVSGAIADDWYRVTFDKSGTSLSIILVVTLGII